MEILFENSYIRNKELAKEIYRFYYYQRKLLVVFYVFISLSLLVNILSAIFDQTVHWGILLYIPLFFMLQFYFYFRQVNSMVKRDHELHGKEIAVQTIVTNAYIQNTASNGAVNKLTYDQVKNTAQTKNLILLQSKANLIYIFRKDTFTKGNIEDFVQFLRSKGVKIK